MLDESKIKKLRNFALCPLLMCMLFACVNMAKASTLSLSPSGGSFEVESTFDVSVILNTHGETINAFEIDILFPVEKLQVVSPSTGKSIASLWVSPPKYNNQAGTIQLRGGIPDGINTTGGNIATISFRAKSTGSAAIIFLDSTKVLLHNGSGDDTLDQLNNAVLGLILPPPAGPIVISQSHPDQSKWYNQPSIILTWDPNTEGVENYSYHISSNPTDIPDDISEGGKREAIYKNLVDGRHYFHIKDSREEVWGGTTHYAINIDSTPPAEFPVSVLPSSNTSSRSPVFEFDTTDNISGVSFYETRLVSIEKRKENAQGEDRPFFVESSSPYVLTELETGKYDMIVRVYDVAGNFREVVERVTIHRKYISFGPGGTIIFGESFSIPWYILLLILVVVIGSLLFVTFKVRCRHRELDNRLKRKTVPHNLKKQLEDLKKYRNKYGSLTNVFIAFFVLSGLFLALNVQANESLKPPLITTVSRNISNDEIPYVGGKTELVNAEVSIYIQNLQDASTFRVEVASDGNGDWFYRHSNFLTSGDYLVWAQTELGEALSPPSPQQQISVRKTALQFGASRISKEELFLGGMIILIVLMIGILTYNARHFVKIKQKKKLLEKEMHEVENAVHRGFATLRRDIQAELNLIKKVKMSKGLSEQEQKIEKRLIRDLQNIEREIGEEMSDVIRLEGIGQNN